MAFTRDRLRRSGAIVGGLLAAVLLLSACDTIRLKAEGSEKRADWGVGILF